MSRIPAALQINLISPSFNIKAQESKTELEPGAVVVDRFGFEMVYVPSGSFQMGVERDIFSDLYGPSGPFSSGQASENGFNVFIDSVAETGIFDTYELTLPAFWMDRYEVTIERYQSIMRLCINTGRCSQIDLSGTPEPAADTRQPQINVPWYDAQRFCAGRDALLPTEEEWEYAASGPENNIFPWGNTFEEENVSLDSTYPVGNKPGNVSWIGVYDMAGNAAEWVEDRFQPYPSSERNWEDWNWSVFELQRTIRGGSWGGYSRNDHI